jgi:hypothetical protein
LNFWGIYEMAFPEGSNMKAPRGFRVSLWSLFFSCPELFEFDDDHGLYRYKNNS